MVIKDGNQLKSSWPAPLDPHLKKDSPTGISQFYKVQTKTAKLLSKINNVKPFKSTNNHSFDYIMGAF